MANFTFANDDSNKGQQGGGKVTAGSTNFRFAPNEFARNMQEQGWTGPSMDDMYGQLSGALQGGVDEPSFLFAQEQERQQAEEAADRGPEQMSSVDWLFSQAGQAAEALANSTGFQDSVENGDPFAVQAGKFLAGLPGQVMAAPFSAAQNLYELATGRNIQEADREARTLGEELDTNQRAASGLQGAIDLAGAFMGGSGRAIGGAINLGRAAAGRGGKQVMQGWVQNAGGSALGQAASDVAEEAAEEAASSLISDVRFEQFGEGSAERALESAGWGAFGGGVMSGAGLAANKVADSWSGSDPVNVDQRSAGDPGAFDSTDNSAPKGNDFFAMSKVPEIVGAPTQAVQQRVEERAAEQESHNVPGSTSYTVAPGDWDIDLESAHVGIKGLKAAFQRSEKDAEALAKQFGHTQEEMRALFEGMDADPVNNTKVAVDTFNSWLQQGIKPEIVVSRDPHTKLGANIKLNITKIDEGNTIRMNPALPQIAGGDIDGDTVRVWNDTWLSKDTMYPVAFMRSRHSGTPQFPWEFSALTANKDAMDAIAKDMSDVFGIYGESIYDGYRSVIDRHTDEGGLLDEGGDLYSDLSEYWGQVYSDLMEGTSYPQLNAGDADHLVSRAIHAIQLDGHVYAQIDKMTKRIATDPQVVIDQAKKIFESADVIPSDVERGTTAGTIPSDARFFVQVMDLMDFVSQHYALNQNPYLRDSQQSVWTMKEVQFVQDAVGLLPSADMFDQFILWQLNLLDKSQNPITELEGTFKAYVASNVSARLRLGSERIGSETLTFEDFRETFKETYNEYARLFNSAMRRLNYDGEWVAPLGSPKKKTVDSMYGPDFCMAVQDVFGGYPIGYLFDVPTGSESAKMGLAEYVSTMADEPNSLFRDHFATLDQSVNEFMLEMIRGYRTRDNMIEKRIDSQIEECAALLKAEDMHLLDGDRNLRFDEDGSVVFDMRDRARLDMILTVYQRLMGVDAAIMFRLGSVESAMQSPYAKYLFSGDADQIKAALESISLSYTYGDCIRAKVAGNDEAAAAFAAQCAGNSRLHRFLSSAIVKDGDYRPLIHFTDMSVPLSEKQRMWEEIETVLPGEKSSLFIDSMRTDSDELSAGELALRSKNAGLAVRTARKIAPVDGRNQLAELDDLVRRARYSEQTVMENIKGLALDQTGIVSASANSAACVDSMMIAKQDTDKAKTTENAHIAWQMASKTLDYQLSPLIDRLTGGAFGTMSEKEIRNNTYSICRALFDPEFSITVTSEDGRGYYELNRKSIYASVGIDLDDSVDVPSFNQFKVLMSRYPQLMTWLAPTTWTPTFSNSSEPMLIMGYQKTVAQAVVDRIGANNKEAKTRVYKNEIKRQLLGKAGLQKTLVGIVCDGHTVDELASDTTMAKRLVDKATDDLVDMHHYWLSLSDDDWFKSWEDYSRYSYEGASNRILSGIDRTTYLINSMLQGKDVEAMISRDTVREIQKSLAFSFVIGGRIPGVKGITLKDKSNKLVEVSMYASEELQNVIGILSAMYPDSVPAVGTFARGLDSDDKKELVSFVQQHYMNDDGTDMSREAAENSVDAMLNMSIASVRTPTVGKYSGYLINRSDLLGSDAESDVKIPIDVDDTAGYERLVGKIRAMHDSGLFGDWDMPDSKELKQMGWRLGLLVGKDGRRRAASAQDLRYVYNHYNSHILSTVYRRSTSMGDMHANFLEIVTLNQALDAIYRHQMELRSDDDLVQEVRSNIDKDVYRKPPLKGLAFRENAAAAWANRADVDMEAGGNPTQSGIDGGFFRSLESLSFLNDTLTCDAPPRDINIGDLKEDVEEGSGRYIWVVVNGQTRLASEYVRNLPADIDDSTPIQAYDVMDCPHACCAHHTHPTLVDGAKNYSSLRYLLLECVFYASEPRVFKSKKKLNAFDHIVRKIQPAQRYDMTKGFDEAMQSGMSPYLALRSALASYRDLTAKKINDEMRNVEGMDDFVGMQDARMLAAFCNPIIQLTVEGQGFVNVSVADLSTEERFAKYDIDWSRVTSVKPIQMSVTSVCSKITNDLLREFGARLESDEGRISISREDMDSAFKRAIEDWSGFRNMTGDLSALFDPLPALARSFNPALKQGMNNLSLQRFLQMQGIRRMPMQATADPYTDFRLDESEVRAIERATADSVFQYGNYDGDRFDMLIKPIEVVSNDRFVGSHYADKREADRVVGTIGGLSRSLSDPKKRGLRNAPVLLLSDVEDDIDRAIARARYLQQPILVPEALKEAVARKLDNDKIQMPELNIGLNIPSRIRNSYSRLVLLDPSEPMAGIRPEFDAPIRKSNPMEWLVAFADRGILGLGDSGVAYTGDYMNRRTRYSESFSIKASDLIPGAKRVEVVSGDELNHVRSILDSIVDEPDPQKGFVTPRINPSHKVDDHTVISASKAFFDDPSAIDRTSGFKSGVVASGQVIGFVKDVSRSVPIYAPIYLNQGGMPYMLNAVYADTVGRTVDSVRVFYDADLTPAEHDSIKMIFDNEAFKGVGILATDRQLREWIQLAHDIPKGSSGEMLKTEIAYSGNTEDSRLIDKGTGYIRSNLYGASRVVNHSHFLRREGDGWVPDYDRFRDLGWSDSMVDLALSTSTQGWTEVWKPVLEGRLRLFEDVEVNQVARRVIANCLRCNTLPSFVFGNLMSLRKDGETRYLNSAIDYMHTAVFANIDGRELCMLYNAIDPRITFDPRKASEIDLSKLTPETAPIIDLNGDILFALPNGGGYAYGRGHIFSPILTEISSAIGLPAAGGRRSDQQVINRSLQFGLRNDDVSRILEYMSFKNGDYSRLASTNENLTMEEAAAEAAKYLMPENMEYFDFLEKQTTWSRASIEHRRRVIDEAETSYRYPMKVKRLDGTYVDRASDEMKTLLDSFRRAVGGNADNCSYSMMNYVFKLATGYSFNGGDGSHEVTFDEFRQVIQKLINDASDTERWFIHGGEYRDRISVPMPSKSMLDLMSQWGMVKRITTRQNGQPLLELIEKEMEYSRDEIGNVADVGKRNALNRLMEFAYNDNGLEYENGYVEGSLYIDDLLKNDSAYMRFLGKADPAMAAINKAAEAGKRTENQMKAMKRKAQERRYVRTPSTESPSGFVIRPRESYDKGRFQVMNKAKQLNQSMGLAAVPVLPASSAIARVRTGGLTKATLWLSRNGVPIYDTNLFVKNQDAVRAAAKSENVRKVWAALNTLQFQGDQGYALMNAKSGEEIVALVDQFAKENGKMGKLHDLATRYASAEGFFMNLEIENFINFFAQRLDPETQPWWTEDVGDGKTRFEQLLEVSPEKVLVSLLTWREDNPRSQIDYMQAQRARNMAMRANLANLSLPGLILSDALENHPVADFVVNTCVSRFPLYAFNVSGWFMQFVAPVSTVNYLAVDWLGRKGKITNPLTGKTMWDFEAMGIDRVQAANSLREALTIDVMHIGFSFLGGLLFALTGALEPPEDEDKRGNLDEWTLFGFRIGEEWWMTDIAGPALAIAATWSSALRGDLRLDLIPNWFGNAMFSNPILKVSEVVGEIMNYEDQYVEKWANESEMYEDALTGQPSLSEVFLAEGVQGIMNWFGQFITPSFIRELYNDSQIWEKSYKRVYSEDETGLPVEDGYTMETSYLDSKVRQITRKNPVLGLLCDMAVHPNTSYMAGGSVFAEHAMPRTVYMDPAMQYSRDYYSILNEDGSEKTETEKRVIAYEIISLLAAYDDTEELAATGFSIDSTTRMYVSQTLWDCCNYESELYNAWVQETGTDANVVGNGDFQAGYKRVQEIKQSFFDSRQDWQNLYYRLWDESLTRGVTMYNRYNTTYAKDANGEWYATGLRPTPIGPFMTGPDRVGEANVTMGREEDWATRSAVTGESTGQRALVPYVPGYEEIPDFESWSEDGKGNGYSTAYTGDGFDPDKTSSLGYGYRSYGGGYRSYSRGGGGGGGYTPNIYSRVSVPYMSSARTMYGERLYHGDINYLRPDFQTKGSREAYKRSDI